MYPRLRVKIVLRPRADEKGAQRVAIRLYKYGKEVFMSAGFTLAPKHWNENAGLGKPCWVRRSNPDFEYLNGELDTLVLRATFVGLAHFSFTAAQVREYLLSHPDESLEELQRKALEASDIRILLSRASPEILAHFERLSLRLDQTQQELDALKVELTKILALQTGTSWVPPSLQRGAESTDAQSKPRRANRNRFQHSEGR